jgi:hypothetical protein
MTKRTNFNLKTNILSTKTSKKSIDNYNNFNKRTFTRMVCIILGWFLLGGEETNLLVEKFLREDFSI